MMAAGPLSANASSVPIDLRRTYILRRYCGAVDISIYIIQSGVSGSLHTHIAHIEIPITQRQYRYYPFFHNTTTIEKITDVYLA